MKLITPHERVSEKQKEQERLAKEGAAQLKQVEDLRTLKIREEQALREFRDKNFAKLNDELHSLALEKNQLEEQIRNKKQEFEKWNGPLEEQWKEYVRTETKRIESLKAQNERTQADLDKKGQSLASVKKELEKAKIELKRHELEVLSKENEVENEYKTAHKVRQEAENKAQMMLSQIEKDKKETGMLLRTVKNQLKAVQEREKALDSKEKEVEEREMEAIITKLTYYSPIKHGT